jgi:hypothetical protein
MQHNQHDVTEWYYTCPDGVRVGGCYGHVASVTWFLGYERFRVEESLKQLGIFITAAQDIIQVSDYNDSTDDDDSIRYSL